VIQQSTFIEQASLPNWQLKQKLMQILVGEIAKHKNNKPVMTAVEMQAEANLGLPAQTF
jgi:hypothetical protein